MIAEEKIPASVTTNLKIMIKHQIPLPSRQLHVQS